MSENDLYAEEFFGEVYEDSNHIEEYGIQFKCELDKNIALELAKDINEGKIPFEYYSLIWETFKGYQYIIKHKPINFLFVDTSCSSLSYSAYSRNIFLNKYSDGKEIKYKYRFNNGVKDAFSKLELEQIDDTKCFDINNKKVSLENLISIKDQGVLLENKGSGAASIIKTELALSKNLKIDVVAIEEPENHLSHTNLRKMISEVTENIDGKQLFVTTHNNLIVSNFELNKICWIDKRCENIIKLSNLDNETAKYFIKLENHNLLQFILASKVILVEGPTEELLIPYLFNKKYKEKIVDDKIDVISCNGLSYKRYLKIAQSMKKKVAVITDNDGLESKIKECSDFNHENQMQHIFTADSVDMFTWEKALYVSNKELNDFIELPRCKTNARYEIKGQENEDIKVRYMQLHKVDFAYNLIESNIDLNLPQHIISAFEWIKK